MNACIRLVALALALLAGCAPFHPGVDSFGNPNIFSMPVHRDTLPEFRLLALYYTISNNIENPRSFAYVSRRPTHGQLIGFAQGFPSYCFVVQRRAHVGDSPGSGVRLPTEEDTAVAAIMTYRQDCSKGSCGFSYHVGFPGGDQALEFASDLEGGLTEHRAIELRYQGYDTTARIDTTAGRQVCTFASATYSIQPFKKVLDEVKRIVIKEKLHAKP